MGIYKLFNDIKTVAMQIPNVAMSAFGDILLYGEKKDIYYPYVNVDILKNNVSNNIVGQYGVRVYVLDRNDVFEAYNKTELILDELMNKLGVKNYNVNYFTLDYKDQINGIYTDITYDDIIKIDCNFFYNNNNK